MPPREKPSSRRSIGKQGEDIAARYLTGKNYTLLARNYQIKGGEIDIVAKDGDWYVFVEVRYRRNELHAHPLDTFGRMKRLALRRTVFFYLHKFGISPEWSRIDFIGIMPKSDDARGHHIWHLKNIEL